MVDKQAPAAEPSLPANEGRKKRRRHSEKVCASAHMTWPCAHAHIATCQHAALGIQSFLEGFM